VVAAAVVVASLLPMTWPEGRDSFPVSSYPMFAGRRGDTSMDLVVAVLASSGAFELLPSEATGHRHLTQGVRTLRQAVKDGEDRPARLCEEIATWVAENRDEPEARVGIVTASFDALRFLVHGHREPTIRAEHAWCEVGG
jgi:hypothetical protein